MADIRFSPSELAFYDLELGYSTIPTDLIKVTKAKYDSIQNELSKGKQLSKDGAGRPIAVEPSISLSEAKREKQNQINRWRDWAFQEGFLHNGVRYDGDDKAQANITGVVAAVMAGIPLPEGFTWRSKDNQNIPMDEEEIIMLGAAVLQFGNEIMNRSWLLKDYVDSLTTVEDVLAVTWESDV